MNGYGQRGGRGAGEQGELSHRSEEKLYASQRVHRVINSVRF